MTEAYADPVIDAHHHLWDLSLGRHPWIEGRDPVEEQGVLLHDTAWRIYRFGEEVQKDSSFSVEKEAKRLLSISLRILVFWQIGEIFWFFFSKKNDFLSSPWSHPIGFERRRDPHLAHGIQPRAEPGTGWPVVHVHHPELLP